MYRRLAVAMLLAAASVLAGCGGYDIGSTSYSGMGLRASGNLISAGQDQYAPPASAQAATPAVVEPEPGPITPTY